MRISLSVAWQHAGDAAVRRSGKAGSSRVAGIYPPQKPSRLIGGRKLPERFAIRKGNTQVTGLGVEDPGSRAKRGCLVDLARALRDCTLDGRMQ